MQFGLSESQQILKNNARKFFAGECPFPEVRRMTETETAYDAGLWRKMAAQGFLGLLWPENCGGLGLGLVELAALAEEMGRALVPGPFLSTLSAGAVIDAAGSDAQKRNYLAPIATGESRMALALLEANGSWDLDTVSLQSDRGVLAGEKWFVSDAGAADSLVVAARCDGDLALYVVNGGFERTRMPAMDLTRPIYRVGFKNAQGELLARGAEASAALARALDIATVALCAEMTGGMQRSLELAVEYVKTRKQFGKPIGMFQAVQHQCADMLLYTESSRSATLYAAWALTENIPEAPVAVSVAKSYASDACREVGNRAIQVHGGMGFTWENDLHLYYRRAKASEVAFGDAAFHRERIAKSVLDEAVEKGKRSMAKGESD
jgi:alkylation response protein AidB-like acyl-CoA dehydrogenase